MGFLRKNKHEAIDTPPTTVDERKSIFDEDEDEFEAVTKPSPVTRAEFHKKAKEHLLDAVENGDIKLADDNGDTVDSNSADNNSADSNSADSTSADSTSADSSDVAADKSVTANNTDNDTEDDTPQAIEDTDDTVNVCLAVEDDNDAAEVDSEEDIADYYENDDESNTAEQSDDAVSNADDDTDEPIPYEDNFMDDFSLNAEDENRVMHDIDVPFADGEKKQKKKRERRPISEVIAEHKKGLKITGIVTAAIVGVAGVIYIYGCATIGPSNIMGRNIAIENVDVSGLTFEQALDKVKSSTLLSGRNITVISSGKACTINGVEAGLTARVEDTVDRAMRYGKTGNVLIDGFANTLQLFCTHVVQPSADVNEAELRNKLNAFGESIFGELVQHKLEIGEENIICTPGHTGFSGNTDDAYNEIITAINNEQYDNIRITLNSAPPTAYTIDDLDAFVYANPQNASYVVENGTVEVVPEVWGRFLDKAEAEPLIAQLHEGGSIINIPYNKIEPEVKSDDLKAKLFNGTIADYSTTFVAGGNRGKNVAIAASKLNGKILMPNEVFSFNETVGSRSRANGFLEAPEYANGETVMGIGGGTCQVTTTLYNAVLYADLSIVSRLNHMFPVGYAPIGQDATVSDSGVDFKFANNMDYPIKISAVTNGGKLTVSIIGTIRDQQHVVKMENITTAAGTNNADKSVRTYRYVYDTNGNLLRKDDLGKSYYMAH